MNNIVVLRPDRHQSSGQTILKNNQCLSGRYELENILGIGGMSVVYKATDNMLHTFGAPQHYSAIKLVSESMRDNVQAEKLLFNEYAIASRLKHPNIVAIRHFDVCREREQAYLVMDWIEGLLLEELMYRQAIEPEFALVLARQLIRAVHHCHQNQVVHGDIKLSNMIVSPSNHLTLIDFGISSHSTEPIPYLTELRACSHRYAAPEVIRHEAQTPAADIFSLCCVLFRLFTGDHPFPDTSESAEARGWLIPILFSKRHPLDRLLQAGLSWNKQDRGVSSQDFFDVFEQMRPEDLKRRWF